LKKLAEAHFPLVAALTSKTKISIRYATASNVLLPQPILFQRETNATSVDQSTYGPSGEVRTQLVDQFFWSATFKKITLRERAILSHSHSCQYFGILANLAIKMAV
jgi:hypothetical protein